MKMMTHSPSREVRKACVQHLRAPFSQVSLILLGKRLRDKDEEIRRQTFLKLHRCKVTLESFPGQEQRMLIIKEGLTDPSLGVRDACTEFLKASMITEDEKTFHLKDDLSYLF